MSGGTRSYEMARRLVNQGHEVHIITTWREKTEMSGWFETIEDGIFVHWLPVAYSNRMSFNQRIKSFIKFAIFAAKKAVSIPGDIVFATSTPLTISLPSVYVSRKQKIPMIFEVRDLWPELPIAMGALRNPISKFMARSLEQFSYKNSAAVVALSPGMKEGIVKKGYSACKVAVIPNSSDIEMFDVSNVEGERFKSIRGWSSETHLIIYTGTFGLINGVDYLVDLAKEIRALTDNVSLLAIGDGMEFESVIERAKTEGVLGKNLFIEKQIPKGDIPAALNAADMVCSLFIDKEEMQSNSANKFFDGLAAKKPILINYGGWQKELIESSGAGIVIWKLSPTDAAHKIVSALQDHVWLANASLAAEKLSKHMFDRNILAAQLEQVFEYVLANDADKVEQIAPGKYSIN